MKIGHRKLIKIIREELNYALLREATEDLNKKWKDFRFRVLPGDIGNEIISYKEYYHKTLNYNQKMILIDIVLMPY